MQAQQQAVQISMRMQKQQADFLGQQAIFMQQVLQQMGPTIDKQVQDKQTKQTTQDKQVKDKQISSKQISSKQKTDEAETQEDQERRQLGVVGSSSATSVGAWHDASTLFVELEAANYLAATDRPERIQLQRQKADHRPLHQLPLVQRTRPSRRYRQSRAAAHREAGRCCI